MSQLDKDKCPDCTEKIKRNVEILTCCICSYSFHPDCQKVTSEVYKTLKLEMDRSILWCCNRCRVFGDTVTSMINKLSSDVKKVNQSLESEKSLRIQLEETVKTLEDRIKSLEDEKIEEKIGRKVKDICRSCI